MGKEGNPVVTPPVADPTVTPPVVTPPAPDPAEEQRRENESLKKQLADKDRFITDLNSEKATLEARLTQTQPKPPTHIDVDLQKEASRILETAQIDPTKAGEELANLIKATTDKAQQGILSNLQPIIEQNTYIAKVKSENKDLIDLGLELSISKRAYDLMQTGKTFSEAVDTAVKEARGKVDKLKSNAPPVPPTPPPAGAVGESGSNRQPEVTPPPKEETPEDEIKREKERRRKQGL